jgi:hypothetical protein
MQQAILPNPTTDKFRILASLIRQVRYSLRLRHNLLKLSVEKPAIKNARWPSNFIFTPASIILLVLFTLRRQINH